MWTVACLVNDVNIPNEAREDLFEEIGEILNSIDEVADENGRLIFSPDSMENMDYLSLYDEVIKVLKRYDAEGDICFGSLEGDNAGQFWGYRFDGQGGMKKLEGKLVWKEKKAGTLEGKTIVVTGSFGSITWLTRKEVEEKIKEEGGRVSSSVSRNTDLLVVGDDPGSKLQKAKKLGVKTISGKEFLRVLESGE